MDLEIIDQEIMNRVRSSRWVQDCDDVNRTDIDEGEAKRLIEEDPVFENARTESELNRNMNRIMKFVNIKRCASSKLQIVRRGFAEVLSLSCFSVSSKRKYLEYLKDAKKTYVAKSKNCFLGDALYAAEDIEEGEFICLYLGRRMSWPECKARLKAGANGEYLLYVRKGVIIDGYGVDHGGALANHSCKPNAELVHEYMPGRERAPVGMIKALTKIKTGTEIEVKYGYFDPERDGIPDLNDLSKYVPCKCNKPNCLKVFKLIVEE